jgi:hypothetical protein
LLSGDLFDGRYCLVRTIMLFAEIGNYFVKIHKKSATLEGLKRSLQRPAAKHLLKSSTDDGARAKHHDS